MFGLFRRRKPLSPGPINEDWRYGDLAEMIQDGLWDGDGVGPALGDVHKVLAVAPARHRSGRDGWFLAIGGFRGRFDAAAFRKVPPLNSIADARFVAEIKGLRPTVRA